MFEMDFPWGRDTRGYDLLADGTGESRPSTVLGIGGGLEERIARRGGKLESYRPLADPVLYAQLMRVTTPAGLLDFVERFGSLTERGQQKNGYDKVEPLLEHAAAMRKFVDAKAGDDITELTYLANHHEPLGRLDFRLVLDRGRKSFQLRYEPRSLLVGLWHQVGQSIEKGLSLRQCLYCHESFLVGPGAERRSDAKFCNPGHQEAFKSQRRSHKEAPNA